MDQQPGDVRGLVFNIQRFSLHDGPGIRTTVFLQGCPLRCRWCSNPESWYSQPVLMIRDSKCTRCGRCLTACPAGAITPDQDTGRKVDRSRCDSCLRCVDACLSGALVASGRYVEAGEVMHEVLSDKPFYDNSGGGITVSGGEPLFRPGFTSLLLRHARQNGLHTALDTCGFADRAVLDGVLPNVDLALFDLKHPDNARHAEGTGKDNELIVSNLMHAAARVQTWLRLPLIPGYNDSEQDLERLADIASRSGVTKVSVLPYHEWGRQKYEHLGLKYTLAVKPPLQEMVAHVVTFLGSRGLRVTVGS